MNRLVPHHFGPFLAAHRARRGWTRVTLATMCNAVPGAVPGISPVSIRFWETSYENRAPSAAQLAVLAEVFSWSDRQVAVATELLRLDASRPTEMSASAA